MATTLSEAMGYKIPASETAEGKARLLAYYAALVRFVDMFSRTEAVVTLCLWGYAGTKVPVARIVFAGTPLKIALGYIKEIAKATNVSPETRQDMESVFQQLSIITGVRNDILHYGATSVAEGQAIVSNALKAKGDPNIFPISPEALDDMTTDLRKIAMHLNYRLLGRPWPRGALGQVALNGVLQSPWRYKHRAQPSKQTKAARSHPPHKRGPKPPRRPRSSQM